MSMHRPTALSTTPPPPFRPNSPDHHRTSRRWARPHRPNVDRAREQLLFGNAKVKPQAVEDQVQQLRQHDGEQEAKVKASQEAIQANNACNSSKEAANCANLDSNNMEDVNEAWGWPGFGTWPGFSERGNRDSTKSDVKPGEVAPSKSSGRLGTGHWSQSKG